MRPHRPAVLEKCRCEACGRSVAAPERTGRRDSCGRADGVIAFREASHYGDRWTEKLGWGLRAALGCSGRRPVPGANHGVESWGRLTVTGCGGL